MAEYIKNPLSGKLRGVTYEDGKIIDVHIRDTDDVVKVFVPVRRGRWLNFYGDFSTAECDICAEIYEVSPDEPCRKEFFDAFKEFYKFCPNCGAKMDGGGDHA